MKHKYDVEIDVVTGALITGFIFHGKGRGRGKNTKIKQELLTELAL